MTHPHNIPSHPFTSLPIQGSLLVRQLFPQTLVLRTHGFGVLLDLRLLQFLVEVKKRRRRRGKTQFFSSRLKVDVENPWTLRVIAFGHDVLWHFDAHDFSSEAVSNSNRRVGRHNARISSMMIRKSDALQYSKMASWKIPEVLHGGVPSKLCLIARYSLGETHQGINSLEKNWMVCGYKTNH